MVALVAPGFASAEFMTVQQLKDQIARGAIGEAAAVAYFHGAVDGMLAMDSLAQKQGAKAQWCKFEQAKRTGKPLQHPAFRTKEFVLLWEKEGQNMQTIAPDFVLSVLDNVYGCGDHILKGK